MTAVEATVKKLGKRPKPAIKIAQQLGSSSYQKVTRTLGVAAKQGLAVKTEKGWIRAS